MFILSNLLQTLGVILDRVLELYGFLLLIAVLVSWVSPDPSNPLVRFLRMVSEPIFAWIRRRLPFTMVGMMDLSPVVAFLGIWFIRLFLVRTLFDLSVRLR